MYFFQLKLKKSSFLDPRHNPINYEINLKRTTDAYTYPLLVQKWQTE